MVVVLNAVADFTHATIPWGALIFVYSHAILKGGELRTCQEIIESTFERVRYGFTTDLSYHMLWW
jgi:hypothetical protein